MLHWEKIHETDYVFFFVSLKKQSFSQKNISRLQTNTDSVLAKSLFLKTDF